MKGSTIFFLFILAAALVWYRDLRPQKPTINQVMAEMQRESDRANARNKLGLELLRKMDADIERLGLNKKP